MTATTVVKTWAMLFSKADGIARNKILFSKLLDVSEVFETFMYAITSHKKQRAKISKEDAIAYRENSNSSQEVKLQSKVASEKKHPQTLDTDNQLR